MQTPLHRMLFVFGMVALMNCATARAGIIGGSDLVTAADLANLESWLGEGPLDITNVFDHDIADGKSSYEFHDAVDGLGRTFSVIEVLDSSSGLPMPMIIGGYNPVSWNSAGDYTSNPTNDGRTAFLFNLTSSTIQRQNLDAGPGYYQTYNAAYYGPTFGGGHDIYVDSSLTTGYTFNYSYGGTSFGPNILGETFHTQALLIGRIEVFTIAPAAITTPEPTTLAGLGVGLLASVGLALKRRVGR